MEKRDSYLPAGSQIIKIPPFAYINWHDVRPAGFDENNGKKPITALLYGNPDDPKAEVIGWVSGDSVTVNAPHGATQLHSCVKSVREAIVYQMK